MLSFSSFVQEARRNKDHPSQRRLDAFDVLEQYVGRDDISITYTIIDKVGINPKSKYPSTPSGVFTFPLDAIWADIYSEGLDNVPFEIKNGHKFVFVVKETVKPLEVSRYSKSDYKRDLNKLGRMFGDEYVYGITSFYEDGSLPHSADPSLYNKNWFQIHSDTNDTWVKGKIDGFQKHGRTHPFYAIEAIVNEICQERMWSRKIKKVPVEKNRIYRQMGYDAISDKTGLGLIHPAEKTQIVFLSPKAYKVVDKIKIDHRTDFLSKKDRDHVSDMRNSDGQNVPDSDRDRLTNRKIPSLGWKDSGPVGWED